MNIKLSNIKQSNYIINNNIDLLDIIIIKNEY